MNKEELANWRDWTRYMVDRAYESGDMLAASLYMIISSAFNGLLSRDEVLVEEGPQSDPNAA